ncbi:hypothetical protein FBZ94_11478 [Bradyrhizobium sacchari]|uniref:Uncharacterized protein n=1 Tax=Bradyrhizobium sacchari TaxID=1399419 RepID=A0A560HQV8_9BRAD|nr:hypothetical protein FBZ94_11478 [Bradyrhizobium sacchari]TWB67956.1 hypothetical protein FBZ95_11378 [Bradyrhizobium sacchari]
MQSVLSIKQVSRVRVSLVAPLTWPFAVRSVRLRWTCRAGPLRGRAMMRRIRLLPWLFRVAHRSRSRRRHRAEDQGTVRDGNSQDWGEKDPPVVFVAKQRVGADKARVDSRTDKRIGVLYFTRIAQFTAHDLLVLSRDTKQSVVRTQPRFSPCNLSRAEPLSLVPCGSCRQPSPVPIHVRSLPASASGHPWSPIDGTDHQHG